MVIAIPLFSCLSVLAAVTFVECSLSSTTPLHIPFFLVGEDTPVWLADRPDPSKPVVYTRLEEKLVKKAIEYWKEMQASDGFPIRQPKMLTVSKNVNYLGNQLVGSILKLGEHLPNNELQVIPLNPVVKNKDAPNVVPLRDASQNKSTDLSVNESLLKLYPSILVVADYDYFLPMTKENEERVIKERILYTLAFWKSVAWDVMVHIERLQVYLRIAGIVITRNRKASPYINNSEYYTSLVSSLTPMLNYWTHDANNDQGVLLGSYDIVAHMTDSNPYREAGYKIYAGIASTSNPCAIQDNVSGIIVYDDLAFLGIHTAVEKMTNVFGDNSISWKEYTYDRKQWTQTTLDNIYNGLKNADCMSQPKEHYPPGKPVFPIMAGELLPRAKQCEAHGFSNHTYHCWNSDFWGWVTSTCINLKCSNSFTSITCSYSNPTLDGTFCNADNTRICLDGECISAK